MALRCLLATIFIDAAMAIPWDPKTGIPMNGHYTYAKPGQEGAATGLHRGTDYFEVVSPSYFSTYAQVNWNAFTVPIDPKVVEELDGKLVNFVGYEFDMVRTLPNGTHVSVPAWELYNHHFGNTIMGKGVSMIKTHIPSDGGSDHEHHPGYKFVNTSSELRGPLAQYSSGGLIVGNGAESRKTFHYFAEGFGVLVDSPVAAALHPMIIDTKNREGDGTEQRPTGHGIVPASSTVGPDQMYSPIHECPCTDKWPKKISTFSTLKTGACKPMVHEAETCFDAAAELGLAPVTRNLTVSSSKLPLGCSVTATAGGYEINFNMDPKPEVQCGAPATASAPRVAGRAEDLVNITLDLDPKHDLVTITLQGPADVWFGAGFGYHHVSTGGADPSVGVSMIGTNWTVVVLPNGTVEERKLGNHEAGVVLPQSVKVSSNDVADGLRTVIMTRSIAGVKSDDYKFDVAANAVTYINAVGASAEFGFHGKNKASGVVYLLELEYPTCICDMAADQGTIGGFSWGTQRCTEKPLGQMLDDPNWLVGPYANPVKGKGVNPSCDIHKYRGGLRCCKGGTVILDSNQTVKNNMVFEWQLKYRYYYEVVEDESKVVNTFQIGWWTEHNNGEHDVPVCLEKDKSKCQNTITSNFTAGQMCPNGCRFITMEGHCHIGCLAMEMWIMDDPTKPQLLCNATVKYGKGDGWMDEVGYIAGAQTCIFGPGFQDPVNLHPSTKLMSVKISNNTNPYTGDMGLWEINAAPLPMGELLV